MNIATHWLRATTGAVAAFAVLFAAGASASADSADRGVGSAHAVFVQTDNPGGNQIVVYAGADDGTLGVGAAGIEPAADNGITWAWTRGSPPYGTASRSSAARASFGE